MAATNQGLRQASVRAVTGTTHPISGDWHALFDLAGIPAGDFNGRLLAWINERLGVTYPDLPGAMQAFAESQGAYNWSSMGTFEAGGFEGILDELATPAGGAWSMARRLAADFTGGPARLRRVSDNDLLEVAFDGDGVTDTAAVATWIGGSSATVRLLYDHVASQDLGQATTGDQPAYNGSLQNARAGLSCADSGDRLAGTLSPAPSGAQAHCLVAVGRINGSVVFSGMMGVGDASSSSGLGIDGTDWWWGGAFMLNNACKGGAPDTGIHIFVKRYNGSGSARLWVDGTEVPANTPGTVNFNFDNGGVRINTYDGTNGAGTPQVLEAIWFPTDITDDDLDLIHANLGAFYGITVP